MLGVRFGQGVEGCGEVGRICLQETGIAPAMEGVLRVVLVDAWWM